MPGIDNKNETNSISVNKQSDSLNLNNKATNEKVDESLENEFIDYRSITIALVKNYCLYRKVNSKTLNKRIDYIGSSVDSSRILSSNRKEIESYFPNLVGVDANSPEFILRIKKYLNNIRIPIDEFGKTFDTSFCYYHKKDYLRIVEQEKAIEKEYNSVDKSNIINLKKALKLKINKINNLESTKCLIGYPLNVEDYLMYRHCLLYNDVAKDLSLINIDKSIRFYIKDDKKEEEKLLKLRQSLNSAKTNYLKCIADDELFEAVYIQYCVLNNLSINASLLEKQIDKEIKLDKFANEEPIKFNKIVENKNIKTMGLIEKLIARGELIRSIYNQNITTVDGELIGANINEAIEWFNNPENNSIVNEYYAKLKNI